MLKRSLVSLLWVVIALFVASPAFAQSTSAALSGRVTDATGAPLAGAEVSIFPYA
jgi:hypothetical protein